LIEALLAWRAETPYAADSDYIFASPHKKGTQPYWFGKLMQIGVKPIAESLQIPMKGWHTLRHSYTTLLRQNGNNVKVVQDLLRPASFGITMNIYDAALSEEKREAHSGVMRLIATRTQSCTGADDGRMASA
jgi:integrase